MKLLLPDTHVKTGRSVVSQNFGIGDIRVIMEILRSKMYSDAIRTIVQEVGSNARDAHREVNKADVPIEIKLPNNLDPTFHIRDFGPGITPDRMSNVFIQYGNSTKRDDNVQTGGFGLGAKSPFAYSDTFGIISITPDEEFEDNGVVHKNVMIRRQYVAVIDESRIGKLMLVSEEITEEPQGTTIVVTCKPNDFAAFQKRTKDVCENWTVRPIIKGVKDFKWEEIKVIYSGSNWKVLDRNSYDYYNQEKNTPIAIVDGIPYRINYDSVFKGTSTKNTIEDNDIRTLFQYPVRLIFSVGEIQLTANREDIDYQASVIKVIQKRFLDTVKELRASLSKSIENCSNLWEANCEWLKIRPQFSAICSKAIWKGIEVTGSGIYMRDYKANAFIFTRQSKGSGDPDISRKSVNSISFGQNTMLTVDDTGVEVPSKLRIATLFDKYPTVNSVQVMVFYEADPVELQKAKDALESEHNFSKLEPIYLSKVDKKKIARIGTGVKKPVVEIKEFYNSSYYKDERWKPSTADPATGKGYYMELKNKEAFLPNCPEVVEAIPFEKLAWIVSVLNIKLYGVHTRYIKNLGAGWKPITELLKEKLSQTETDKEITSLTFDPTDTQCVLSREYSYLWEVIKSPLFVPKKSDSLITQYKECSLQIDKISSKVNLITQLRDILKVKTAKSALPSLSVLSEKFGKKYPLLKRLNVWDCRTMPVADLLFYIDACDEK